MRQAIRRFAWIESLHFRLRVVEKCDYHNVHLRLEAPMPSPGMQASGARTIERGLGPTA